MFILIISLSALSIGHSYGTSTNCPNGPQSQMATLNERMNQIISALYESPLFAKSSSSSSSSTSATSPTDQPPPTAPYETAAYPVPQLIYVSPLPPSPAMSNSYYKYESAPPLESFPYSYPATSIPGPINWPYSPEYPHYVPPQVPPPPYPPSRPGYPQLPSYREYYHPEYPSSSAYGSYAPPTPRLYPPIPASYPPLYQTGAYPPLSVYAPPHGLSSYLTPPPYLKHPSIV